MRAKYKKPDELLTASEVARYVYCERAWAYDRKHIRPHHTYRRRLALIAFVLLTLLIMLVVVWQVGT